MPLVSRTRATLRRAELGFLGVAVQTRVQTPRRWGAATRRLRPRPDFRPGVATFFFGAFRPLRTSCEVVGMRRTMLATNMRGAMEPEPIFRTLGDSVFAPTGHARGPWDPDALHGGAPTALVVRVIEGLGTGLSLGRLTIDFLGPVPLAPLSVAASVVRPGRRFAVAEATISANGRPSCVARAVLVRREPVALPSHWTLPAAERLAPPSEGAPAPFTASRPGDPAEAFHLTALDLRFVAGDYGSGPADVWFRFRRPLVDDAPASALETLAAAADFGNGVSHVLDFEQFLFVNLDLSIQVAREPRGEWIALAARTAVGEDGTGVARSTLHDADGPVGDATQTLFVAPR